ncbi:MAG: Smr/MutS family protein [Rhodobacterales bacterium]
MTRRRLRPDEVELWRQIAATTDRLHPEATRGEDHPPRPKPKPRKTPQPRLPEFSVGQATRQATVAHDLKPALADQLRGAPVSMDSKAFARMKRGKLVPEGRIDLHGMNMDRAHPALTAFILRAQASGKRLVLVITGKGRDRDEGGPIPVPRGILKHQVPNWLSSPPLAQAVLQITEAHISHGGAGAYYVYLRRHR